MAEYTRYKKVLADYLEICNKSRDCGLSKFERKQKHNALVDWKNKDYGEESLTICDIKYFWEENSQICWNKLFICKVICPIVAADLEIGGLEGLKLLFHCFHGHENSYIYADNPLAIFCEYSGYKYQPFQLANLLLEHEPTNVDALNYKYYVLKDVLEFSLHEMPAGVLNGMNGASISDIPFMLKDIEDFENLSQQLALPKCDTLIEDCRRYYTAYKDYLLNKNRYSSFEEYLNENELQYQSYTSRYDYE